MERVDFTSPWFHGKRSMKMSNTMQMGVGVTAQKVALEPQRKKSLSRTNSHLVAWTGIFFPALSLYGRLPPKGKLGLPLYNSYWLKTRNVFDFPTSPTALPSKLPAHSNSGSETARFTPTSSYQAGCPQQHCPVSAQPRSSLLLAGAPPGSLPFENRSKTPPAHRGHKQETAMAVASVPCFYLLPN